VIRKRPAKGRSLYFSQFAIVFNGKVLTRTDWNGAQAFLQGWREAAADRAGA
jgi:hypothetical protein